MTGKVSRQADRLTKNKMMRQTDRYIDKQTDWTMYIYMYALGICIDTDKT